MIAKTLIKYSIIEWCLNSLVDTIALNFRITQNASGILYPSDIKDGMRFTKISDGITTWHGCIIQRIEIHYDEKTKRIKIWFSYDSHEDWGEPIGKADETWIDLPYYDGTMEFIQ